ncbi:DivIVA domain-containing protein [Micromonospora sp. 4G57]|uniref:DivIVA domain-containing protein n=1 Tax=Micromonospora sicca TaxID=2202420 RepID=A0ABU5JP28_9ACTN|nr:DivIVA domain-containing protein [Micromonospora sp. 4G57]MDZ5447606.1 DivIVA domain-containing protein [Micromonospora sp. 4G57]MDZ5494346.1 DivIVA domain-containing protein [Micromonospora sp. 4G53]
MTVYRSRHALRGPLTPDRIAALALPLTRRGRRGYQVEEVDALLHRLAFELQRRIRERDEMRAENQRIKGALRAWQSEQRTYQAP